MYLITKKEAMRILTALGTIEISLDLGKTKTPITVNTESVIIGGHTLPKQIFSKVKEDWIYIVGEELTKLAWFSEETQLFYKLVPTRGWPTFTLSATPMHRHIHITPEEDTRRKIKLLKPFGKVLDTCCGLGYSALMSANVSEVKEVHTFERDENVLEMVKINPYSTELLIHPKIKVHHDDITDGIEQFPAAYFDCILHDPPTPPRAPDLYLQPAYELFYKAMKKGGRLYHYTPNPHKWTRAPLYETILVRLKKVGFRNCRYDELSSGVYAEKC